MTAEWGTRDSPQHVPQAVAFGTGVGKLQLTAPPLDRCQLVLRLGNTKGYMLVERARSKLSGDAPLCLRCRWSWSSGVRTSTASTATTMRQSTGVRISYLLLLALLPTQLPEPRQPLRHATSSLRHSSVNQHCLLHWGASHPTRKLWLASF